MTLKDIIPTLSIVDKLKEIHDEELSKLEKSKQNYQSILDEGFNHIQKKYNLAILELEYHTENNERRTKPE